MEIKIPELSLVVLIGASGSGKSTLARRLFKPGEVLSSDAFRALVSNDENDQTATEDAFDSLHYVLAKRLKRGLLTVIDATNVQEHARKQYLAFAKQYHVFPVALVLDVPQAICYERNATRNDRDFGPNVIQTQSKQLRQSLGRLKDEGFRYIYKIQSEDEANAAVVIRERLWNNRKDDHGPFDIIGDIHGCYDELVGLLGLLGYAVQLDPAARFGHQVTPPPGRRAIFLGDLVDRGPRTPDVLRLVMTMVQDGCALCIPGNHDIKLVRALDGKRVQIAHGLQASLDQLAQEDESFVRAARDFLDKLISHYLLDDGRLVVAHAGLKAEMQGRGSGAVREFCLYGETTGETDEFGLPVRYNWAADYRGKAMVVYGHTPVPQPEWLNNTICLDTGCVFGGSLTAMRYPEGELVQVAARQVYAEPIRPLAPAAPTRSAQHEQDDWLDLTQLLGRQHLTTQLIPRIVVDERYTSAALEVMSRFAVDPRWLVYLPPTMSPTETSKQPGLLEHPAEAFDYFRKQRVTQVVCEEKHMGSRAVVVICRDASAAQRAFGFANDHTAIGTVYTRTGRSFFTEAGLEEAFLNQLRDALTAADWWSQFQTDWVLLDCELMPWNAKAQALLEQQYAPTGAAGEAALAAVNAVVQQAQVRGLAVSDLVTESSERIEMMERYRRAYRHYCWPVVSLADYKLAPFHILATEGAMHSDKPHSWHMEHIHALCQHNTSLLRATQYRVVDLTSTAATADAIAWWEALTKGGGEGMVVKPLDFVVRGPKGLVQPAMKCRGSEYLRIIYGPEYTAPANLERLRARGLATKRNLALREFALGLEALNAFVRKAPLRGVHQYVFAVLALESEPVDPRL